MLVNHNNQYIFLHNPKCGGTSVESHLLLQGFEQVGDPKAYNEDGVILRHSWHIPTTYSRYTVFTTVRHPYDTCLSYWRHYIDNDLCKAMSFMEWIEDYGCCVPHQSKYIAISHCIVRLEQIHDSDLPFNFRTLPHLNQSSSHCFLSELIPEARRLIWCLFRDDFSLTGYRP